MLNKIRLILVALLLLQSCKTVYKSTQATAKVSEQSVNKFLSNYNDNNVNSFQNLQIKSNIDVDLHGKSHSASMRLYFEKDKMIWANVSMLGITGARAKLTPEKAQAYEIIDKTFIDGDYAFFNQKLKVDFIDFEKFQHLLLGQLFLLAPINQYQISITEDNLYKIAYEQNLKQSQSFEKSTKYKHSYFVDSKYRLKKMEILDVKSNTGITVEYENWVVVENINLPTVVKILVKGKDTDQIRLEYNNFEFSEMEPPFRIPKNYKRRSLN